MEEIYIDYNGINHLKSELDDCAEIIRTDSKKILEYVSEINNVWKGTAANIFSSRISEYAEAFQDKSKYRCCFQTFWRKYVHYSS